MESVTLMRKTERRSYKSAALDGDKRSKRPRSREQRNSPRDTRDDDMVKLIAKSFISDRNQDLRKSVTQASGDIRDCQVH